VAWSLSLPLATLASSRPYASGLAYPFSFFVYLLGSVLCHQRPERSFFLWGSQMPVCARCTGIYLGAAFASLAFVLHRGRDVALDRARMALIVAAVPTAATLAYEWTTGQMPGNWIRAAAGVPLGLVVAWIVCRLRADAAGG